MIWKYVQADGIHTILKYIYIQFLLEFSLLYVLNSSRLILQNTSLLCFEMSNERDLMCKAFIYCSILFAVATHTVIYLGKTTTKSQLGLFAITIH